MQSNDYIAKLQSHFRQNMSEVKIIFRFHHLISTTFRYTGSHKK